MLSFILIFIGIFFIINPIFAYFNNQWGNDFVKNTIIALLIGFILIGFGIVNMTHREISAVYHLRNMFLQ